jgi:hypothetical protein
MLDAGSKDRDEDGKILDFGYWMCVHVHGVWIDRYFRTQTSHALIRHLISNIFNLQSPKISTGIQHPVSSI